MTGPCEMKAAYRGVSCRRGRRFYVAAADVEGATGLHVCPVHIGQAVVAATAGSGRTSVLVVLLGAGPTPP